MKHIFVMLPLQEEKIRNIFTNARSFAVVSSDEASEEITLAQEALAMAIRNAGMSVYTYPERQCEFLEKWSSIIPSANNNPVTFSTSILIPKNKIETKEISYTEDDRYVSINISASKEEISKENVVFKTLPTKVDAVFYLSPPWEENRDGKLTEEMSKKITPPEVDKIINISSKNNEETVSEKILSIINIIESNGDVSIKKPPLLDLVFATLMVETDQFQKNISERSLADASSLVRLGANKEKIARIINDKSPSFARLLGRAMARSYPNESLKSMWTFIADQDLEKTGNKPSPALFGKIMKKIKNLLEPFPFFVLIWQSKQEVWAMISTPAQNDKKTEERLSGLLLAKKEGNNLISGPYKNFSETELRIQNVLKEVA